MNKTKLIFAAALLFTASCANEDVNKDNSNPNNQGMTTFVSGDEPATRTSMDHTAGGKGKFFWTTGDNIWIDNAGTPESNTSSSITGKTNYAKFYFASTLTGTSYPVTYTGKGSTKANEVTIAANQTQSAPNNTDHFATSGDCGTATATGSANQFVFKLKHQAAYICIQPRCENAALGANIYLTKIVVTSNNDIAGTYNLTNTGLTPKSGGTKTITLTTQGAGTDPGFKMTNTTANIDRNGAYMVIAPGHHTLTIDCYLKDPTTEVEGFISQTVSAAFAANTVTDITANLTPIDYGDPLYCQWDATIPYTTGSDNEYNPAASTYPAQASNLCKDCPNINQAMWYIERGNACWDADLLWSQWNHLYKSGIWIKKSTEISGFTDATAPDGTDYRIHAPFSWNGIQATPNPTRPTDTTGYFFLPTAGIYTFGSFLDIGEYGQYWTSSTLNRGPALPAVLVFYQGVIRVFEQNPRLGVRTWTVQ
ncbi:MAG: hypothetical protein ACTTJL_04935 [Hoylesella enoeca]|uniref:hypothetical protein n=1 Tax=Hoylesella enoeca TaxID=76123 RepID=UPI003FA1862A